MKKPTKGQMKKRPSLWICPNFIYLVIVYQDSINDYLNLNSIFRTDWEKGADYDSIDWMLRGDYHFLGWL